MKPEAAAYLAAADKALNQAHGNLSMNFADQAARLAYFAMFHAAQALIFERTGKVAKTHKGGGRLFHQLARAESGFITGLPVELTSAYRYKELADYETGSIITRQDAVDTIGKAEHFVAQLQHALSPPPTATQPC